MKTKILFEEKQHFRQIWLWILFLAITIHINYLFFTNNSEFEIKYFILHNISIFLIVSLFYFFNLKTRIEEEAIHFQFYPFHIGFIDFKFKKMEKNIPFEAIEKMEVVKYNPLFDYGGWGIRFGGMNTIAYNTMGNKGLMIYKKNKEKVLIGTQKPEELKKVIEHLENNSTFAK